LLVVSFSSNYAITKVYIARMQMHFVQYILLLVNLRKISQSSLRT